MAKSISLEMGAPIDWASTAQTSSGASHIKDFIKRIKEFLHSKEKMKSDLSKAIKSFLQLIEQ